MKEFSDLRTELNEGVEELAEHMLMPPQILILRRITVRQFPGDTMVALYKNDRLGLTFSIPYGTDVNPVITPVNEGHKKTEAERNAEIQALINKPPRTDEEQKAHESAKQRRLSIQRYRSTLSKIIRYDPSSKKLNESHDPIQKAKKAGHLTEEEIKKTSQEKETERYNKTKAMWDSRKKRWGAWKAAQGKPVKEESEQLEEGGLARTGWWMAEFENHVNDQEPRHAGKIEWDTAHHLHNTGHAPVDAARKYVNSKSDSLPSKHDPEGIEKNAWGKLHEESEHGVIQRLRNIKDFHSNSHLTHADGSKTRIDPTTAHALLTVHDALKPEHQAKFVQHLEHSKQKFHKMLDFTWKNVK